MVELHRDRLTPQMQEYAAFNDLAEANHPPYLMYFHRPSYRSSVINTDASGFRYTVGADGTRITPASPRPKVPVRVISGSSTTLGLGATSDEHTLASRLWSKYAPSRPWLNFGGRCHNPVQEALLFTLYRHLVPEVEEVVVFSGLNALCLARLPDWQQGDHGAFWFCGEYFEKMDELRRERRAEGGWRGLLQRSTNAPAREHDAMCTELSQIVERAVEDTLRQLETWALLAPNARVTFVLQPFSLWLRDAHAEEEQLLFDEIDRISKLGTWEELYGNVSTRPVKERFAAGLEAGCRERGIKFIDLNPAVSLLIDPTDWIFVDRAHYTDMGHDLVARVLADALGVE